MELNAVLEQVDVERLYQHVLRLEGVRHPLDAPDRLRQAGDFIQAELASYGLPVRTHEFCIKDWDDTFFNVEAWLGPEDEPAAVLINHYDTVSSTLGANDNAAGVAVMLEVARVLAGKPGLPAIRLVSASLEEGLPPPVKLHIRASARRLGLVDERGRYTSYRVARAVKRHGALVAAAIEGGQSQRDALISARQQLDAELPPALVEHLAVIEAAYEGLTAATAVGLTGKLGSSRWVDEALALNKPLAFAICLDEIGTTSQREGSQWLPERVSYDMLPGYRLDPVARRGDWALILADAAASQVAEVFGAHCRCQAIDLPHGFFQMPGYDQIAAQFPQALGSDHAPFWRAGIPAIFCFDTATWRNPHGHSMADTIDRLDFDHISRICKATLATLVDPALRGHHGPR